MSSTQNDALVALYRYAIIAHRIHAQFKQVQESAEYKQKQHSLSTNEFIIYLLSGPPCLYFIWCGLLYTVVEGYQELKLSIAGLLAARGSRRGRRRRRCWGLVESRHADLAVSNDQEQ